MTDAPLNQSPSSKRLFIVTGDHSADIHAAGVCKALWTHLPEIEIEAIGGSALQALDNVSIFSGQEKMARMGAGSIQGAPYHYFLGKRLLKRLKTFQPDALLLMDYGVFNLWIAGQIKQAQKRGKLKSFPVYYFIPPQVWASRKGRIEKIRKNIDRVFCIFPFEDPFYQKEGIPATYVGHPLIGQLPEGETKTDFCTRHNLNPDNPLIGIFPGSRKMEIDYMLAPQIGSIPHLLKQYPNAQFVLAQASSLKPDYFEKKLSQAIAKTEQSRDSLNLTVVQNENHAVLSASDAVICTSGTVTLEAALYKTPGILMYKGHPVIYQIFKRLCYLPCIGLPNILTDMKNPIMPELWQKDVNPAHIASQLSPFLDANSNAYQHAQSGFKDIRNTLGQWNAIEKLAEEIAQRI